MYFSVNITGKQYHGNPNKSEMKKKKAEIFLFLHYHLITIK